MRSIAALVVLATVAVAQQTPESGFLMTAPKVLQAGTAERACLSLFNLAGPGRRLLLTFSERDAPSGQLASLDESDFLLFQSATDIPDNVDANGEYCFDINVPNTVTTSSAQMVLHLTAPGQTFTDESKISIKTEALLTLVQTDKAKYQPGQKVLFRVITLSHDLKAMVNDLSEVWVTSPDGTRIDQWRNVKTNTGMAQMELQLTEEPPLGRWQIHVKTSQVLVTKSFVVEEYVLPTFELTIEAPDTLESGERTITVKVCAEYTFGKPLVGANITINATASIARYQYRNNPDLLKNVSDYQFSDREGCALFDLLLSKIGIGLSRIGSGNTVTLKVEVEEAGTGLKQAEQKRVSQQYSSIQLREGNSVQRYLKPGLAYYGSYNLKRPDGQPAPKEIIKVCYTASYKDRATSSSDKKKVPDDVLYKTATKLSEHVQEVFGYTPFVWETDSPRRRSTTSDCREYRTDDNGDIVYYIPPQAEDIDKVDIRTSTSVSGESDSSFTSLKAFFSPSRTYLSIDAHQLPAELPCTGAVTVQLLTTGTAALPTAVYRILARGSIIKVGEAADGNITINVLPKMAPEFKLLVYHVLASGEVVSDSSVFKVKKCFPDQVQVSWDKETVKPGDSASFTIRAAPNSVCGISAVDRSTELLGTGNQITMDTVFNQLDQFVIRSYQSPGQVESDDTYCKARQLDLVRVLKSGGATKTDLTAPKPGAQDGQGSQGFSHPPRREPRFRTDRHDALKAFDDAGFLVFSNLGLETRPCYKRVPAEEIPEELLNVHRGRPQLASVSFAGGAQFAPPAPQAFAFLAQDASAGEAGAQRVVGGSEPQEDQVRDFFPEAFLFSIETLDDTGVKTLTAEMPDTITSWVGSAVCTNARTGFGLSNKTSITTFKPFFTEVSLPYSLKRGEVLKMPTTVFNFLDSSLSVYLELAESEHYSLANTEAATGFDLCIEPGLTETRTFSLTFTSLGEVNMTVSVKVKDGNCKEANAVSPGSDTVIRPIVVKPEGFPQEKTSSRFICLDKGDDDHVEKVSLPLPDGLVEDSERAYFAVIGDLLGPTYSNLESGLIAAPTGGGEPNMVTFVPNIYVRRYLETANLLTDRQRRQTDNNMKSGYQRQLRYRRRDGSYSSYGSEDPEGSVWLTAFVVKAFREASEYIAIDQESIQQSVQWLLRNQNTDSSCFNRVGELIHKEMKGGTERGGEAALTAFVMLALKDVASTDQLAKGFACLEDGLVLEGKTLYSEVLMAHAYLKLGQGVKGRRLVEKLVGKAKREGDQILFWEGDRTTLIGGSRAVDIEMTSYMVLSLLHISGKGYLEDAARAVRWINTQRNSKGGFVATQDTIVAVQALTAFAERTFASDVSSTVSVTSQGVAASITVDGGNRLLLQQKKVPELQLPGDVTFLVSPPGCVVVQTVFRFSSTIQVPDPAFSLGVAAKPRGSSGASYELEVCTSYLRGAGQVDRVILEMEMPSGYIPVDSTLRALRRGGAVRMYKAKEGKVTFTLQKVTEDKTCLEFRVIQESEVENLKPAVVNVYDFYRPEEKNILEYELPAAAATA